MTHADHEAFADTLDGTHYPCGRAGLLHHAAAHGAGDEVTGALARLPDIQYTCIDDVNDALAACSSHQGKAL
jgi:hypothetical protein